MKTAIGYSFLNGEKEHARALDPWYDHVDYIIAIDGRYKTPLSPEQRKKFNTPYSTDNSEHLLKTRYADKIIYEKLHATQMDKRQRYLDIAGELKCDYLIVWDSDDYIHPEYQHWDFFNSQLERGLKPEHQDERIYFMWAWIPDETLWSKQHNEIRSNIWQQYSRIHKYPETQRYAQTHWTFANKSTTDHQINLWKWSHRIDEENPYLIPTSNTIDGIRLTTDRLLRTESELEFGDSWTFQQIHWESFTYTLCPYLRYKGVKCVGMDEPMEKIYFKYRGKVKNIQGKYEDLGQIVVINDDGTETESDQKYDIITELNEEDKATCQTCKQKIPVATKMNRIRT